MSWYSCTHMGMAMVASPDGDGDGDYVAKPPPTPPPAVQLKTYDGQRAAVTTSTVTSAGRVDDREQHDDGAQVLDRIVLVLRAAAALFAFVAMALVASCRHGDWMEFQRYPEYRYLLGVSVVAFLYSTAQALRNFRRMRGGAAHASFLDFAGDQAVTYLLVTASAAALPITIRMRSAVVNVFTDAIAASISLGFLAFAALAMSAMLSGCKLSRQAH